jgi:hypothetical protein
MSAIALIVKPVSPSVGFISVFGGDDSGVGISFLLFFNYSFISCLIHVLLFSNPSGSKQLECHPPLFGVSGVR